MRHWLFHPLVFYPLVLFLGVAVVVVSLAPQAWPRAAEAQAGTLTPDSIVLEGAALTAPDPSPDQEMYVVRDIWGNAQSLRLAVLPGMPEPTPAEQGVRILLSAETGARLDDRPVAVEVSYRPVPINAANGLAVSLQGIGPADWVIKPIAPEAATVRFELPASFAINAIGLRAMSDGADQAYGVEIIRIRVIPGPPATASN